MREIKFRGKSIDSDSWVCGYYIHDIEKDTHDILCIYNNKQYIVEVTEKTVGQYTGVKDKKGKEIYEGDVVEVFEFCDGEYVSDGIGVVEYDYADASYGVGRYPLQWYLEDTATKYPKSHIKILGNIFDDEQLTNIITLKNPYSDLNCVKQ